MFAHTATTVSSDVSGILTLDGLLILRFQANTGMVTASPDGMFMSQNTQSG